MFTNQPFIENKAAINGETVQIYRWISQPKMTYRKIRPLRDAASDVDCLTPFKILKIIALGLKNGLVMLSRIVTSCKHFQILICSPLEMKSLHLLSKFHCYIFNGLGENEFESCRPKNSPSTLNESAS